MTMERDSLVARLWNAKLYKCDSCPEEICCHPSDDIFVCDDGVFCSECLHEGGRSDDGTPAATLEAAAALSRPEQVVTPTSERPTSDALAETQGPYEARLCKDTPTVDAAEQFARWLEQGPKLAKAAGCYVAIKVTGGKP